MNGYPVVVGAGVVGLAVARVLAEAGAEPLVVERHPGPGRETSSRNSGVIHAGLYYPVGSLKARSCVRGNRLLYRFCEEMGVDHRRLGKLVVACEEAELETLEALAERAAVNGAEPLSLIDAADVRRLEPRVRAVAALRSDSTGIVDAHGLVKALEARLRAAGGEVCYGFSLVGAEPSSRGHWSLTLEGPGGELEEVSAPLVVNAAGLQADRVASLLGAHEWTLHWCRGDYFAAPRRAGRGLSRLVYPLPSQHGLGIHATLDLGDRLLFGPDTAYVRRSDSQPDVDPAKGTHFRAAAQRYLPDLAEVELSPDSWGMRPKLQPPGGPVEDFVISWSGTALHLLGIESPGLTACLALAETCLEMLRERGLFAS